MDNLTSSKNNYDNPEPSPSPTNSTVNDNNSGGSNEDISTQLENYLLNLKIISNVKEFDKLATDTNNNLTIDTPYYGQGIVRAWYGEGREATISNINKLIDSIFELSDDLLKKELISQTSNDITINKGPNNINFTDNTNVLFQKIVFALNESISGFQNLKITYINDVSTTTKLDMVIKKIQNRINKINAMLKIDINNI